MEIENKIENEKTDIFDIKGKIRSLDSKDLSKIYKEVKEYKDFLQKELEKNDD